MSLVVVFVLFIPFASVLRFSGVYAVARLVSALLPLFHFLLILLPVSIARVYAARLVWALLPLFHVLCSLHCCRHVHARNSFLGLVYAGFSFRDVVAFFPRLYLHP